MSIYIYIYIYMHVARHNDMYSYIVCAIILHAFPFLETTRGRSRALGDAPAYREGILS